MNVPIFNTITNSMVRMDGGSKFLMVRGLEDTEHMISLVVDRDIFNRTDKVKMQLQINGQPIVVRSQEEIEIVELLQQSSASERANALRDDIIEYVQSDEYVRIHQNS